MMRIDKILTCFDGSESSLRAVRFAGETARRYDAEVTLLHVIHRDPVTIEGKSFYNPRVCSVTERKANEDLFKAAKGVLSKARVRFNVKLMSGNPADIIIEEGGRGFDMVTMGVRGAGSIKSCAMGCVAIKVLVNSEVPVTMVP